MKRLLLAGAGLVLALAIFLIWSRAIHHENSLPPESPPAPAEPAGPVPVPVVSPEEQPARETTPPRPTAPVQVRFEAPASAPFGQGTPVVLVVESDPKAWPESVEGEVTLELLLRLPVGVRLESDGWAGVELPAEEKDDRSGPWSLFERKISVRIPAGEIPLVVAREAISLAVIEQGTNWIMTVRARLVSGSEAWQSFGVLFATVQAGQAEFHTVPRPTGNA